MRDWLMAHAHSAASFTVLLAVVLLFGAALDTGAAGQPRSALPAPPIPIPPPTMDQDLDTYADSEDVMDGDAHVRVSVERLAAGDILPYLVIGTQDDHWRIGQGRALEWPHIVDPDPLAYKTGSSAWREHSIRTGAWWYSIPMEGATKSMAPSGDIPTSGLDGTVWPQTFHVNVRDDQANVVVDMALVDADARPDHNVATWQFSVDLLTGNWSDGGHVFQAGELATLRSGNDEIDVRIDVHAGIPRDAKQEIAKRWAPDLRFDAGELFFPTTGDAMAAFHGFSRRAPAEHDLRTWTTDFNNGRDAYVLLLADFNGDRLVDHRDVVLMTDILRAGDVARETVYAHVTDASADRVVVQYWFLYMYNFVEDEQGRPVQLLAHEGDREFIQLTFDSREDALEGQPRSIAFSQHYRGIAVHQPEAGQAPWDDAAWPVVYPSRGSHASYPAPGDDRRFRSALSGYGDEFLGDGTRWNSTDYDLVLFDRQDWAFGHLWGPLTRHSRDLGTSSKPLLQHGFTYPYIDPVIWEDRLRVLPQDDLAFLYGGHA